MVLPFVLSKKKKILGIVGRTQALKLTLDFQQDKV